MNKSYRIKANVGTDQVLNVNLRQDIDIYEILSLKLRQENLYKLHSADYGVIVGRVLANDAFGVPNAKVTVFIPLSDYDKTRHDLRSIYPYNFVTDLDKRNVKFNALPNYKKFDCHQEVGSFPKKQLVLDEDCVLEVFDKYYKYTTITNNAGDYMIFGVPVGNQILHIDVDLSDIGILSQEPRDFIFKGYPLDLFDSPTQFKKSTNLDDLPQILNQNASVTVYPFWGDKNSNEIAITRKDITLQYKFETTCVFLGSVITDNISSIGNNCIPDENAGEAGQFVTSSGNIEMIRKTIDDEVEEYPVKGNQLIDNDGTWCYQIPMNLDYIGTDEYGNVIPMDDSKKGIPTRARVRFRVTLDESGDDNLTNHKARYLIPNNPDLSNEFLKPIVNDYVFDSDSFYEFGTLTPDSCFRDLYWDKVYSVKNYIPRVQMSKHFKTVNYSAIRGVNKKDAAKNNPIPYNKLNINLSIFGNFALYVRYLTNMVRQAWTILRTYSTLFNYDNIAESVLEDTDAVSLDFYNDWLNGCLYFPSWHWQIRQKKKYKKGESLYDSSFCECKNNGQTNLPGNLYLYNTSSYVYDDDEMVLIDRDEKGNKLYNFFRRLYTNIPYGTKQFFGGLIKKKSNKDGADAYYYTFGNKLEDNKITVDDNQYYNYARLYSTDIILLGSLKETDLDGVPQVSYSIPSTTSNIPPMGSYKPESVSEKIQSGGYGDNDGNKLPEYEDDDMEKYAVSYNGMHWGEYWYKNMYKTNRKHRIMLGSGLFFGIYSKRLSSFSYTDFKSGINAERICELGVNLDGTYTMMTDNYYYTTEMDGLITKTEISDVDSRSLFATLNHNKLIGSIENQITGYKKYDLKFLYPSNFDGRMSDELYTLNSGTTTNIKPSPIAEYYTSGGTHDDRNIDYIDFRLGRDMQFGRGNMHPIDKFTPNLMTTNRYRVVGKVDLNSPGGTPTKNEDGTEYTVYDGYINFKKTVKSRIPHFYGYENGKDKVYPLYNKRNNLDAYPYSFPLYNNSFYFYFGLNRGKTAIDKFYKKFYSKCQDDTVYPFVITTSVKPSDVCTPEADGTITLNVQEIDFPYTVELWKGSIKVKEMEEISTYETEYSGLSNGNYTIIVRDKNGNESTEYVNLAYERISLNYTPVQTQQQGSTQLGYITFNSYTFNGEEIPITDELEQDQDNRFKFKLPYNLFILLEVEEGKTLTFSWVNNNMRVLYDYTDDYYSVVITIKIYQTCNGAESSNVSYYNVFFDNGNPEDAPQPEVDNDNQQQE